MKASHNACGSNNPVGCSSMSIPSVVNVHPPNISKTKGSGKRMKGGKEKAMEDGGKVRRTCSVCGKKEKHNKRSCPKLKEMLTQNSQEVPVTYNATQASTMI